MDTKRFLDATGDEPHVFIFVNQRFTIGIRGFKVKEGFLENPNSNYAPMDFVLFLKSKLLKQRFVGLNELRYATRHYTKT